MAEEKSDHKALESLVREIAQEKTTNILKRTDEERSSEGVKTPEFAMTREQRREIFLGIESPTKREYIIKNHADFAVGLVINNRGDSLLHLLVRDISLAGYIVKERPDLLEKMNYYGETLKDKIQNFYDVQIIITKSAKMKLQK